MLNRKFLLLWIKALLLCLICVWGFIFFSFSRDNLISKCQVLLNFPTLWWSVIHLKNIPEKLGRGPWVSECPPRHHRDCWAPDWKCTSVKLFYHQIMKTFACHFGFCSSLLLISRRPVASSVGPPVTLRRCERFTTTFLPAKPPAPLFSLNQSRFQRFDSTLFPGLWCQLGICSPLLLGCFPRLKEMS